MIREIVGSKFEQDPDDGRTWDEKVQPVGDDDDVEYEGDDGERPDNGAEHDAWAALTEARREVAELEPIVASRPPASGLTFDPQAERLAEVSQRLDMLTAHLLGESYDWHDSPEDWDDSPEDWWWHETFAAGFPPDGWTPVASGAPSQGKPPRLDDILQEQLTEPEWQHFEWLVAGRPQAEIAAALGISQPAVTKRERKLRSRANDIAMEATGREYPFGRRTQAKGGRPRLS
jgi:hypothetical protein